MRQTIAIIALLSLFTSCAAHIPDATAKILDNNDIEVNIHYPTADPRVYYVQHVTIKRGSATLFDGNFTTQTDIHSQDITLTQSAVPYRKRLRKGDVITVEATSSGEKRILRKHVRIR